MKSFELELKKIGKNQIVIIKGELDAYQSIEFKEKLIEAFKDESENVLIDMTGISYIDSAGLGALVSLLKKASERSKELRLFGLKENVNKIFELTRLNRVFRIFDTLEEAQV